MIISLIPLTHERASLMNISASVEILHSLNAQKTLFNVYLKTKEYDHNFVFHRDLHSLLRQKDLQRNENNIIWKL